MPEIIARDPEEGTELHAPPGNGPAVYRRFFARALEMPDSVALVFAGGALSYAELAHRVRRLAGSLRRSGVGPEVQVGLAMERSPEMVVALLAVLEAGGAYVPLDPGYPEERLAFLVEDSQAPLVLSVEGLRDAIPEVAGARRLFLDRPDQLPAAEETAETSPPAPPAPPVDGSNLAYLIYTSGSTGVPKGVQICHRSLSSFIDQAIAGMHVEAGSRVLQLASLSFDASVLEIFLALTTGSSLHLIDRRTLLSGEALGGVMASQAITTMAIPPSLLNTVPPGAYPALRAIVVGGEACPAETANRWAPGRIFLNAYAPTEATIYATAQRCPGGHGEDPPLGQPIGGAELRLLGKGMRPVAAGEEGEIFLGGLCLSRGYHRRPQLTADRFVPDPAGSLPGARLYRTGDLARWWPWLEAGGQEALFFAGRRDAQVKVRGVRIELGEVESVLRGHPAVRDALAKVWRSGGGSASGQERLVAYFVPAEGQGEAGAAGASPAVLRAFLQERLPGTLVPSSFVRLEALPITPTGKADRQALPPPGCGRPALTVPYVSPRTPTEEALASLWAEVLGLDEVGVEDSLFELGGHSLVAARIVARVRQELGVELSLVAVFEQPTVAALAARLDGLAASPPRRLPPVEKASRDGDLPLTYPQERVWFLDRLSPGSIAYAFQFTVRWRGSLQVAVLQRALKEIVRRHESLRTGFPARGGRPVQEIHPPFPVALPTVDLMGLPAAAREPTAEALVHRGVRRRIDPERPPVVCWTLFRIAAEHQLMLQVEHHFIHDGWSLAVFLGELKELYRAFAAGRSPALAPPLQYADFAVWQRRWVESEVIPEQLPYWVEALAGAPTLLELPTDRPRPRQHSFRGHILRDELPQELYQELREFSRRSGVTLFTTMLAAFQTLISRYTGREDFLLGSGAANRRLKESEGMIGMVVNTIVLRAPLRGDPPFQEALQRVRQVVLGAHAHQDLPVEKLVEEIAPDRDLAVNPLFQALFSFHDSQVPELDLPGLAGELFERHNGSAKSDLNVVVKPMAEQRIGRDAEGELTMVWEYSTDLFEHSTIERMWRHYQALLRGLLAAPECRLSQLPMLSREEIAELEGWAAGEPTGEAFFPVHLQVAAAAARHPAWPAVAAGGETLSYGELEARAGALARRLQDLGAGPERVVAVLLDRSPEMVVALYAALLAGAAYLPIDPAYPAERIDFMLADSGAAVLVARQELAASLPERALPALLLAAGEAWPAGSARAADPGPQQAAERLAYLIYTSGSTGRPKGVMLTHGGLANLVSWHRAAYAVSHRDRASQVAGLSFDASVWEIWPYLAAGACLHLPPAEARTAPDRLLTWLAAERVTLTFLPTPMAEAMLLAAGGSPGEGAAGWPQSLCLRAVLTGGDRLHGTAVGDLPFRLVNHYGPTEGTVVATCGDVAAAAAAPPIGRPIAGARVEVLGRRCERVPVGVPGELALSGRGLARGYHRRPSLTAASFQPHPFPGGAGQEGSGSRIYRTGDLVRWRADGNLDFLRRIDFQVKVRGFRVELGEIEEVLRAQPAVAEAVVLARQSGDGGGARPAETRLVAYVVRRQGAAGDGSGGDQALRRALGERLPDYMVPSLFVHLEALPLTANGKVDLRSLPAPEAAPAAEHVEPRTPTEELLSEIWAEVLGVEKVGVQDDFFRLGGHSMTATRVLARLQQDLDLELPLAVLFEAPTVEGLALAVEDRLLALDGVEAG